MKIEKKGVLDRQEVVNTTKCDVVMYQIMQHQIICNLSSWTITAAVAIEDCRQSTRTRTTEIVVAAVIVVAVTVQMEIEEIRHFFSWRNF